jgi:hypothetical protein
MSFTAQEIRVEEVAKADRGSLAKACNQDLPLHRFCGVDIHILRGDISSKQG